MSLPTTKGVWPLPLPPTEKLVLLALAWREHENGCYPSQTTLGRMTGLGERAIRMALRRLEKKGHVQTVHERGRSNRYAVRTNPKADAVNALHQIISTPAPNAGVDPGTTCRGPRHITPKTPARDAGNRLIENNKQGTAYKAAPKEPGKSLAEIMAEAGLPPIPGVTGAPKERQPGAPGRRPDRAAEGRDLETGAFAPNPTPERGNRHRNGVSRSVHIKDGTDPLKPPPERGGKAAESPPAARKGPQESLAGRQSAPG